MVRSSEGGRDRTVGSDRDPDALARAAMGGVSTLVAGSLGSGKSHLLRVVRGRLEEAGVTPLLLRPARPMSGGAYRALDLWPEEHTDLLRRTGRGSGSPAIVIIDDAQDLDMTSAELVAQAIYAQRAVAVAGIEIPRARSERLAAQSDGAGVMVDLWMRGLAERRDLREMSQRDAEQLLTMFPDAASLDTPTRATVVSLADGSRILLREFAAHAVAARAAGADPLAALDDIARHSRAGVALHAHVAQLSEEDRATLAFLGKVPRIELADATRIISSSAASGLVSAGLVHEDGTVRRRLVANRALAREASFQLSAGALDGLLDQAMHRMISARGTWWSQPIAAAIAERWHEGAVLPEEAADGDTEVLVAIALAGAQRANEEGHPTLASAYTWLPTGSTNDPRLLVERAHADMLISARSGAEDLDLERLDVPELVRYLQLSGHAFGPGTSAVIARLADVAELDDRAACEVDLLIAGLAASQLKWTEAETSARRAVRRTQGHAATRLQARLLIAMCRVEAGAAHDASDVLRRAQEMLRDPALALQVGPAEEILLLCMELLIKQTAGLPVPDARQRLHDATVAAAHDGRPTALVLAGLSAALLHARSGESSEALEEVDAATRRSARLPLGPFGAGIQLAIARAVALLGREAEARALMQSVASISAGSQLLTHELALTESCILMAEQRYDDAFASARLAAGISEAANSPVKLLRDQFQLVVLGAGDEQLIERMRGIAASTDFAAAPVVVDHAAEIVEGRPSRARRNPLELLRSSAPWIPRESADQDGGGQATPSTRSGEGVPTLGLTRREREVAGLIAEGLSNSQIAERLFLSVRTVESHVYQARAKLGAGSRAELGRAVARGSARRSDG